MPLVVTLQNNNFFKYKKLARPTKKIPGSKRHKWSRSQVIKSYFLIDLLNHVNWALRRRDTSLWHVKLDFPTIL
jgi:hypothetical protein